LPALRDLCAIVPEPPPSRGRPRLPLPEMLFAAAFKVYSTVSARRFMTDLRDVCARGLIARTPHYNSIFNAIGLRRGLDRLRHVAILPVLQHEVPPRADRPRVD